MSSATLGMEQMHGLPQDLYQLVYQGSRFRPVALTKPLTHGRLTYPKFFSYLLLRQPLTSHFSRLLAGFLPVYFKTGKQAQGSINQLSCRYRPSEAAASFCFFSPLNRSAGLLKGRPCPCPSFCR